VSAWPVEAAGGTGLGTVIGGRSFLLSLTDTNVVGFLKVPGAATPVECGKAGYKKFGCAGCHGPDAVGGVPNPNSKTAQQGRVRNDPPSRYFAFLHAPDRSAAWSRPMGNQ
jgi:mono/diheme cytochrome c family protein